jgi:hypothetical protein
LTGWNDAHVLGMLAAAYAECGDFAHAVEYEEKLPDRPGGNLVARGGRP